MGLNRAIPPRQGTDQQVHFARFEVNFNDPGIATGVPKATIPAGSLIIGTDVHVTTVFNAVTTNVLTAGTTAGSNANAVAAGDVNEAATGLTKDISPTGALLGVLAADSIINAQYTQTGTAATTGKAQVVIKYIPNSDR